MKAVLLILQILLHQGVGWVRSLTPPRHLRSFSLHSSTKKTITTSSSTSSDTIIDSGLSSNPSSSFVYETFLRTSSECDNTNTPPSLNILVQSIRYLFETSGSDIRGCFLDHPSIGSLLAVSHALKKKQTEQRQPLLTPFTAYCIGVALAKTTKSGGTIVIGRDPRTHGIRLADALARGVETVEGRSAVFANLATTPACAALCSMMKCDGAVVGT